MFSKCIRACHVTGGRDGKEDGSEVRNELCLEVLGSLDYLRTGGEDWVDLGGFGTVVHADVGVGDQRVVQRLLNLGGAEIMEAAGISEPQRSDRTRKIPEGRSRQQ